MDISAPDSGPTLMIVDIARRLRRHFEAALASIDTGLTVAEARTLTYVWRNQGQRQTVIAEQMSIEPMTLVGYLDSLEAAGLIQRTMDPTDRRAKLITLTDASAPILAKIEKALKNVRADAMANVSENSQKELVALLETMKNNLLSAEAERLSK